MTRASWCWSAQSIPAYHIRMAPLCKQGRLRTRALLLWRSKRDSLMIGSAQERWKAKCELSQSVEPGGEHRLSPSAFNNCLEQVYPCSGPVSRGLVLSLLYKGDIMVNF